MSAVALRRRPAKQAEPIDAVEKPEAAQRRDITINLRATTAWRSLVDHAAAILEKSRSEFIIDATRRKAEDVLLDQRYFVLDEKGYRAFLNLLDEPPMPNEELKKLLKRKPLWQKQ